MKKKVVMLVLTGVLSLALLGGCGSDKDKAAEATPTQAATPTEAPQENNDEEDVSGDIEDFEAPVDDEGQGRVEFEGQYIEPVGGRAVVSIETTDSISYNVHVEWSGSVSELSVWDMEAVYQESGGKLEYSACTYVTQVYDENGGCEETEVYTDGTGRFWFDEEEMLCWESDQSDVDSVTLVSFEKIDPEAEVINQAGTEAPEGLLSLNELAGSWVLDSDPNDTLEISAYSNDPYSGSFVHTDASGTTQIGDIALFAEEKPDGSVGYWYYFYLDADTVWNGYSIPEQAEDFMAMGQGGDPLYVRVP